MEERPLPQYAALTAAFWGIFGGFLAVGRDRIPERIGFGDLARIALSTYKISRVITKDEIAVFIRAPVTEDDAAQEPKQEGMAAAVGALVTCPYCIGLWVSAGLSYSFVFFPRETRFATTIFSAHGITDFLNAGFVRLREGPATSLPQQPSDQGDV
jgi:hypothetical protein